jgi:hypothetical protein
MGYLNRGKKKKDVMSHLQLLDSIAQLAFFINPSENFFMFSWGEETHEDFEPLINLLILT